MMKWVMDVTSHSLDDSVRGGRVLQVTCYDVTRHELCDKVLRRPPSRSSRSLDDAVRGGRARAGAERGAEERQSAGEQAARPRLLCERLLGGAQRLRARARAGAALPALGAVRSVGVYTH